MAEMVRSGVIDCIGSARGSIADPFLPRKIEEGRLDDVRECIGNNICAARYMQRGLLICTQNATAGEEYRRGWHPEKFTPAGNADLDVLVVGAGPAGMECAMVLGRRGMRRIHLVDAEDELGGTMRWVPRLPGLGEWGRIVNHRRIQLAKLPNVQVVAGTRLDADAVLAYGADLVVVATGARWAADGLSGTTHAPVPGADASLPHVLTPEQIMVDGKSVPGERVLVYDTDGYYMGVGLAELLARQGHRVTLATPFGIVSPFSTFTLEAPRLNRQLHALGVELLPEHMVERIEPGRVHGCHVYATGRPLEWEVDAVVLATQRVSNDALYRALSQRRDELSGEGIRGLHRIGDCVAPRLVADAIFDGHRLAREIDSDDPETPLPFIRENRVLGATDEEYDSTLRTRPSGDYVPSSRPGR
jgi:dimethylamine/trimethylamine dehydrogenase